MNFGLSYASFNWEYISKGPFIASGYLFSLLAYRYVRYNRKLIMFEVPQQESPVEFEPMLSA